MLYWSRCEQMTHGWREEISVARTKRDVVEYRIYDLPVELPILCLWGDSWRISDVPSDRLHFHNCLEIGFCHTASGFLRFEDETVPFSAGDVFMIPRHVPHTTCSARGHRSQWSYLFLDLDQLAAIARLAPGRQNCAGWISKYYRLTSQSDPRLHFLLTCLLEEAKKTAEDNELLLRSYALTAATELLLRRSENPQTVSQPGNAFPLKPALEYIHDHYMEPCDTETLASLCHLSPTHFRRLFLSCMDATPLQFVISTRIYQACLLLANTNDPVLSIAQAVGMPSASSFNRNFQQAMGMSPRQYRANSDRFRGANGRREQVLPFKGWLLPDK